MCCVCYSVLRERSLDPVTIAKWSHPVPSRTWKLSTCTADVALARYASRRSKKAPEKELFLLEGKKSNYDILNFFFILFINNNAGIAAGDFLFIQEYIIPDYLLHSVFPDWR